MNDPFNYETELQLAAKEDLSQHHSQPPALSALEDLLQKLSGLLLPLGYQVIEVEQHSHPQKTLRVFIDFSQPRDHSIGVEDCAQASHCLSEALDQEAWLHHPAWEKFVSTAFDLEVSSPGLMRPLRGKSAFERFKGQRIQVHTFRALLEQEVNHPQYYQLHPKQKNFTGILLGLQGDQLELLIPQGATQKKSGKKGKKTHPTGGDQNLLTNSEEARNDLTAIAGSRITIPLPLISKANLEPEICFERRNESE